MLRAKLHACPSTTCCFLRTWGQGQNPRPLTSHFSIIIVPAILPKSLANSSSCVHVLSHGLALGAPTLPPLLLYQTSEQFFFFFLPRNSQFPSTNLSAFLGDCSLLPELFLQFTSPRSLFLDFNRSATCCQFVFAAGPCYP